MHSNCYSNCSDFIAARLLHQRDQTLESIPFLALLNLTDEQNRKTDIKDLASFKPPSGRERRHVQQGGDIHTGGLGSQFVHCRVVTSSAFHSRNVDVLPQAVKIQGG